LKSFELPPYHTIEFERSTSLNLYSVVDTKYPDNLSNTRL
jgi:hypothetical protein